MDLHPEFRLNQKRESSPQPIIATYFALAESDFLPAFGVEIHIIACVEKKFVRLFLVSKAIK